MFYRFENSRSERRYDDNGYLFVNRSPILKAGVMEYLGSELLPAGHNTVDGVEVDPQKIYRVNISLDELKKAKDSFKLNPIVDGHTWLGDDGADAKSYQEGSVGENLYVEDGFLYAPLSFTGKTIIEKVKNHKKEELSTSYQNRLVKSNNPNYDFEAVDIRGNHLALVDRGRAGSDVRVLNSIMESNQMSEETKVVNSAILEIDGERLDLNQLLTNNEAVDDKDDKEKDASKPEDSKQDNKCKNEGEEVKDAKDEKKSEDKSEPEKEDKKSEDKGEDKKDDKDDSDASKTMNYDAIYEKVFNSIKAENEKNEAEKVKAYNSARGVLGDFNPFGMSCKDMYVKALNHLGVMLDGNESDSELGAMLKACSSVRNRVDNGFNYGSNGKEEIEFNL